MDAAKPSRTAMLTAAARAAHLVVDREPWIFEDVCAARLLGDDADELVASHHRGANADALASVRVAITTRSRYAENRLADAVRRRGTAQYVLLGARLDSFAYRSPLAGRVRVFEVDHPATPAWKRRRLGDAGISPAERVRFVPVDFGVDALAERLLEAGLDHSEPAFVSRLGVSQYLSRSAITATLDVIGGLSPGSELVMEYLVPAPLRDAGGQAIAAFFMPLAAAVDEPWLTFLTPAEMRDMLAASRVTAVDDVGRREMIDASLWRRSDHLRPHELGRLVRAVVDPSPPSAEERGEQGMSDLPEPVAKALAAANANDTAAFLACFTREGVVDDWGREFRGAAEIREWSEREFIGVHVSLEVTAVEQRDGATTVTATVGGDGFNGPSHFTFAVDGDRVTRMTIRA
jgi:methyltransferase (TIGR00027 family)